ncbi:16.9 kDa class I heat shock protein 1-like [Salvia divinorum]|uniref:16.9 kDa class I heat shock protein 1-like n=1 Tax=Salvia divinorum TaxID=28513 RepID=A0ABD1GDC7_SALDI
MPYLWDCSADFPVDKRGKTTLYLADIAQGNRVVSKTICWGETGTGQGVVVGNEPSSSSSGNGASVDWRETVKAHVLKVDVPGFKKEEVKVEVEDGGILQISAERSKEEEEESEKWHCKERSSGILRRLRLPESADLDEMKASMENGVLTVTVPKEEVKAKKQVKIIEISG